MSHRNSPGYRSRRNVVTGRRQAEGRFFRPRLEALEDRLVLDGPGAAPPSLLGDHAAMRFEANLGQADAQVRFLARGDGYALFLTSTEAVLSLSRQSADESADGIGSAAGAVLAMQLVGANPSPLVSGQGELPGKSNYLRGNDPARWQVNVPNYAGIAYQDVYAGIDLVYHGSGRQLEYDFIVAPGADPGVIRLVFHGANSLALDEQGNLVLHTAAGDVVQHAPILYQEVGTGRQAVSGSFVLEEDGTVGFTVGAYDVTRPLVIDPILAYGTYLGNSSTQAYLLPSTTGNAIAVDREGNAYVTGSVATTEFPITAGALQTEFDPVLLGRDAFVTKLDPSGQLVYSTYLGGNPDQFFVEELDLDGGQTITVGYQVADNVGRAIAVDDEGNVYVTGDTEASDGFYIDLIGFAPLVNPFQITYGGGTSDAFVAKLNADGTELIYSSYLGGELIDFGSGIAVDGEGNAYVVGTSIAISGPSIFSETAFVAKIGALGALVYNRSFGFNTAGNAVAVDAAGNVYFTGSTTDTDFAADIPVGEALGEADAYVGRLSLDGFLVSAARLGGSRADAGLGIALDGERNVYLTGSTFSVDFPTTDGAFQKEKPGENQSVPSAFVTKLDADLSDLVYATYLGGSEGVAVDGLTTFPAEVGRAIAVDASGAVYVVGETGSADFPTVDAVQPEAAGTALSFPFVERDAFVVQLDAGGARLLFSTYLGGTNQDVATGIATDAAGNAYVVGTTGSTDWPTTAGAIQETYTRAPGLPENPDARTYRFTTSAFVARFAPPLTVTAEPVHASLGQPFTGVVATFTAPNVGAKPTDFKATVDWGDGVVDANATILHAGGPGTPFQVVGSHTYVNEGAYPIVVRVTERDDPTTTVNVSRMAGNQSEPTIAIDPHNPNNLFVASNNEMRATAENSGVGLFAAYSTDGGKTWTHSDLGNHLIADGNDGLPLACCDPRAVFDQFGNLFFVYLDSTKTKIVLLLSTDGGKSFTEVATSAGFTDAVRADQPSVAVGPGQNGSGGSVWVTFAASSPLHLVAAGAPVTGLGAVGNFTPVAIMPRPADSPGSPIIGNHGGIDIGPDGQVVVTYQDGTQTEGPANIYVNLDPDGLGPEEFKSAVLVPPPTTPGEHATSTNVGGQLKVNAQNDSFGIDAKARPTYDRAPNSPHRGRLYLAYTDSAVVDSGDTDVFVRYSDDNGATWRAPVRVNDDQTAASQFWPSLAVDQTSGNVALSWYDTRLDTANFTEAHVFAAVSRDGGATFSRNVQITAGASNAENNVLQDTNKRDVDYGDYAELVFHNGWLYPVFADNSRELGANPDLPNFDVAVGRMAVADVRRAPPVVVGIPLSLTEGQSFSGAVATFTVGEAGRPPEDFTATINWGDDSVPSPGIVSAGPNGFTVRGNHAYAEPGSYVLGITVRDNVHGLTGATAASASVANAPLTAKALDVTAEFGAEGEEFTTDLAEFTDADANVRPASHYSAVIDWGDGTTPGAGVIRREDDKFIVAGTHAYAEKGAYTITITIKDKDGAEAKVTLDADIEDASKTATGRELRPAQRAPFNGVAATFIDDNPGGQPNDFVATIDWGDGSPLEAGRVVYAGTAALTWDGSQDFLAIGNWEGNPYLLRLSAVQPGVVTPVMPLGSEFFGGLTVDNQGVIYALSNNDAGQSYLNRLNPFTQTIDRLAYLGIGFTGGLTFNFADGNFYAIANGAGNSALFAIDPRNWTVRLVGGLGASSFSGLAAIPSANASPAGPLFAVANDGDGASTLYRINLGATPEVTPLFALSAGFTGGLAVSLQYAFQLDPLGLLGELVGIASDAGGSAVLNHISLQGPVTPVYEVGAEFSDGLAVVGAHTYVLEESLPVSVHIAEPGGSGVTAESTAEVVDEPPVALRPPATFIAYQGFTTGPLTLADFFIPSGVEPGPVEYTATINWGDGSVPESGIVTASGNTVSVLSSGHTYSTLGVPVLGGKGTQFFPTITLSSDAGASAAVTDTITVLPDVTQRVRVVGFGGPANLGNSFSFGSLTNVSATAIPGPLFLVIDGLPAGVTVTNPALTLPSGQPVVRVNIPRLDPGQTFAFGVVYANPAGVAFTPQIAVIDGPNSLLPVEEQPLLAATAPGFEVNAGQADSDVRFLARGSGYALFLTSADAVLALQGPDNDDPEGPSGAMLRMQLVGADHSIEPVGLDPLLGRSNYLIGDDPAKWHTDIRSFGRVHYKDVYPGISLDYHASTSRRLEHDFIVAPGADPGVIRLAFQGADGLSLDAAGNLVLHTAAGDVVQQAPVIYQEIGGTRQFVTGGYEILGDGQIGFRVGPYDLGHTLVIDPVLVYSTYLGGSVMDVASSVAVDAEGNTYVTGYTWSPDFPSLDALQAPPDRLGFRFLGGEVAFVTKLDPAGAIVYSTLLGGSAALNAFRAVDGDRGAGIAVNAAGEAYLTGTTASRDFPTTVNALQPQFDAARPLKRFIQFDAVTNAFVTKLSADGSSLVWSTYLGGSDSGGSALALDAAGNAYVAGVAGVGFQTTPGAVLADPPGFFENKLSIAGGFVAKLSGDGEQLLYTTYLPGTEIIFGTGEQAGFDFASGAVSDIAVDAAGNAYVTGYTRRIDRAVVNAAQADHGGGTLDAFVAKLNATGSALDYWTYLGGSGEETGNAIAVDATGSAYVAGSTQSTNFPMAGALQAAYAGGRSSDTLPTLGFVLAGDAFVTKLSADGRALAYSTYVGSSGHDTGRDIAVDAAGNAYLTGQAGASDFATVRAIQPVFGGDEALLSFSWGHGDAFLARLDATGTALDYSTFLGGSAVDGGQAVAVGPAGEAVVVGFTNSVDFPTLNAAQPQPGFSQGQPIVVQPHPFIPGQVLRVFDTPNAFVTRIDASGSGILRVTNVPFQPTEAVPFTGVVAAFTDTDTSTAADYVATIDWGDGTTSAGIVTSASARGGSFVVSGAHTYAEEGSFPVTVTVHDAEGSFGSADSTIFAQTAGSPVTYRVSVDTTALAGTSGFLAFQLNPGAPSAQSASAAVSNFASLGGSLTLSASTGDAGGSLAGAVQLNNSAVLNELRQAFTFGTSLTFDVRFEGDALSAPSRGLFGSTFSLTLLGADGVIPLQAADLSGAVLRITLAPDGSTQLFSNSGDGAPIVRAAAVNTVTVADAPVQAVLVPFQAIEGISFIGTVVTFTCANPASPASDFTATILWDDDTAASEGTIVADGGGRFHVVGSHTYVDAGDYALRVVVRSKGGSTALAVAAPQTAPIDGLQAPRVVVGDRPLGFATADFNGDGKTDLAVWRSEPPNFIEERLYVLLGNGDGSFQDPAPVSAPAPSRPGSSLGHLPVVAADFNGDGKTDLAAAGMVYLGNGNGTFQTAQPFDAGPFTATGLAVADLNGDARLDLVAVNGASAAGTGAGATVQVLLGNGDGTFGPRADYGFGPGFAGSTIDMVVAGDFTGDGKTDVVVNLFFFGGRALLFRNNGDGTFGAAELLVSGFTLSTTADVDGDGNLDLVGTDGAQIRLLLGDGGGAFPRETRYDAGDQPIRVLLEDFDGDGNPDLAVADQGGVPGIQFTSTGDTTNGAGFSLLKGNGDGTFAAPLFFATTATAFSVATLEPGSLQAADFNGDGNLDLALRSVTGINIVFGRGDGSLVVTPFSFSGRDPGDLAVADFSGDGRLDVALAGFGRGVTVLSGNGDGAFLTPESFQTSSGLALLTGDVNGDGNPDVINGNWLRLGNGNGSYRSPALNLGIGSALPAAQVDLDQDAKLDVVSVEFNPFSLQTTVAVWLGNGDGTFAGTGSFTVNERVYSATVADFDRDGKADLALGQDTLLTVLLGNGDGTFQAPRTFTSPNSFQFFVVVGDFNGDANADLAATGVNGVSVLLGNGDGTFADPVKYVATVPRVTGIAMGDVNGDSKSDLFVADRNDNSVIVLLGNGDGSFTTGVTVPTGSLASGGLVAADFTGDGRLDFAIADSTSTTGILLFPGNGAGAFGAALGYALGQTAQEGMLGSSLVALATQDVNNDARPDLITANGLGAVNVILAQDGGTLAAGRTYLTDRGVPEALAADLNRDGLPDLITIRFASSPTFNNGAATVLLNRGDGTFQTFGDYDLQSVGTQAGVVTGDFNGDGVIDLLADLPPNFATSFTRRFALLLGNGDGTFQTPPRLIDVPNFFDGFKLLAQDVNGDGNLDVVRLAKLFTGGAQVEVSLGNGDGTFQPLIVTGPLIDVDLFSSTAAKGFAAADFTGDGKLDLVIGIADGSVRILPGNGDGAFGAQIDTALGVQFTAFATGDLDGDGNTDLVTRTVAGNLVVTVSLLSGNGDGTFRKPITYLGNGFFNGIFLTNEALVVADFNGDARPDVVVGSKNMVTVLPSAAAPAQNVADAPLSATGLDHRATVGAPLLGIVARFTDANPFETESDFTATITWGDGQTSAGTVQPDGEGGFVILGSTIFAQTGTYNVTTRIVDEDGGTATASGVVTVESGPDAPLTAVGVDVAATARVPFTGIVATFTDADPLGAAADFVATIDWGDGQTSLGRVQARAGGGFEVIGAHTYAEAGTFSTAITIVDTGGSTASAAATALVAPNTDPPLTATGLVFHATEQTTFTGVVATFSDADPAGQLGDYTARIDWGDGETSTGIVLADPAGGFVVTGSHGYRDVDSYSVTVVIVSIGGAADTAHSTGVVADAPLTALGRLVTATEGAPFTGVVASFTDANPFSTADEFTATITWGDGQISAGAVTTDPLTPGRFEITGANTYAAAGKYVVTVAVVAQSGVTAAAQSVADVANGPLAAAGVNVQATPGVEFTAVVARFTDQNPGATAGQFTATITWGDGTVAPGVVAADPEGGFAVTAAHIYAEAATYVLRISILDDAGDSVTVTATAAVIGAPAQTAVETVLATEGIPFAGRIASFFPARPDRTLADFVAAIAWGDGQISAGTILADPASGRFDVIGETTYAEQGQYPVTLTIADRTGIIATLSTTAAVADAPLTATGMPVNAIQGEEFTGVVAIFTDANPLGTIGDFTATIDWGDGQTTTGTITADPLVAGQFNVVGTVVYADAGSFPVMVSIADVGGATAVAHTTAVVVALPTAAGTFSQAVAGLPFSTVVATIADNGAGDLPGDFTATITWDDGHVSSGLVTLDSQASGQFRVLGSTVYAQAGTYSVAVAVVRHDGFSLSVLSTVDVSPAPDAPLVVLPGLPISGREDQPLAAVVATFRDDDRTAPPSAFAASILWGDGSSSSGRVIADPGAAGQFLVVGDHVYADAGAFPVTVAVREEDGDPVPAETTALVTPSDISNVQPIARRDSYVIDEDKPLVRGRAAGVLANDTDADGAALTARVVRQPRFGTLILGSNGSFRYQPNRNFNGRDSFDYVVSDGQADSAVTTVQIKVRPVVDPVVLQKRTFFVPGRAGEKTVVRFDWLARDASFNNEVAIVRVDDAQGRIGGRLPGDAGYLQAALAKGRWQRIFPSGAGAGASRDLVFKSGERFMVFIVQNATVEMLSKSRGRSKGAPAAFFMDPAANPFGFDHVRLSRLDNGYRLAWEDLLRGGDRDFNDVVIAVRTLTRRTLTRRTLTRQRQV